MAGLSEKEVDGELDGIENVPTVAVNPVLSVGESRRFLSWIWYDVGERETSTDSGLVDGQDYHFCVTFKS
jgi:hypothetical protein